MTQNDLTDLVVGACQVDTSAAAFLYQQGNIASLVDNGLGDFTLNLAPPADGLEHQYDLTALGVSGDATGAVELVNDNSVRVRMVTASTGAAADIDFQLVIRKIRRVG